MSRLAAKEAASARIIPTGSTLELPTRWPQQLSDTDTYRLIFFMQYLEQRYCDHSLQVPDHYMYHLSNGSVIRPLVRDTFFNPGLLRYEKASLCRHIDALYA